VLFLKNEFYGIQSISVSFPVNMNQSVIIPIETFPARISWIAHKGAGAGKAAKTLQFIILFFPNFTDDLKILS
jgi:hypothetical protein